jgi:hypothetical protein
MKKRQRKKLQKKIVSKAKARLQGEEKPKGSRVTWRENQAWWDKGENSKSI